MTITKKHFKSLAVHLGTAFKQLDSNSKIISGTKHIIREAVLIEVMNFCKEFNANFDNHKFEEAVLKAENE